jgi:hypothetical protein
VVFTPGNSRDAVLLVRAGELGVPTMRLPLLCGYAPLRVLIYENEEEKTCVEYDKPSSLFGQFGNTEITAVAVMLDGKLEALVVAAIESH